MIFFCINFLLLDWFVDPSIGDGLFISVFFWCNITLVLNKCFFLVR
jgi:hypothetical protein